MPTRPGGAFEQLFVRHRRALIRFLSRKLGSVDDAQEIAQDAFLRLLRLENPDEIDNTRAFLFQVAANMAVDRLRRRGVQARVLEEGGDQAGEALEMQGPFTPEQEVAAREHLRLLFQSIEAMPTRCRQALLLHRLRGLSYAEIAREMGVSVSSVEKYILEALKHLRNALELK